MKHHNFSPFLISLLLLFGACSNTSNECYYRSKTQYISAYEAFMEALPMAIKSKHFDWDKAEDDYEKFSSICYACFQEELTLGETAKLKTFSIIFYGIQKTQNATK